MIRVRRGSRALVGAVAIVLAVGVLGVPSMSAAATAVPHAASAAHPYSDPIYYPLHDFSARMDCVVSNPGCTSGHSDQAMTLQTVKPGTSGGPGNYVHVNVYPAGSGIVHIGAHATAPCGPSAPPLGNWVWIDHGGGLVTRYAHLTGMQVTEGEYVDTNTVLGQTGNSGEQVGCFTYYLNFQIKGGGEQYGTPLPLRTLFGCSGSTRVTYPTVANPAWTTFNDVPKGDYLPASDTECLPTGTPATLGAPSISPLSRSGKGALTLHWRAPVHRPDKIQVEVRLYHPANNTWEEVVRRNVTVGSTVPTSYQVRGLISGSRYDARVSFHNGVGWSLPSSWTATQTPT